MATSIVTQQKRKPTVFQHYSDIVQIEDGITKTEGACNYCNSRIRGKAGVTSNFITHLRRKHPDKYVEVNTPNRRQPSVLPILPPSALATPFPSTATPLPSTVIAATDSKVSIPSLQKSKKEIHPKHVLISTLITKMIVTDLLPLKIVEGKGFRELIQVMDPSYEPVSEQQMKQIICPWYTKSIQEKIKALLAKELSQEFTVTLDVWSPSMLITYIGVSLSFLTTEWLPKSIVLACTSIARYYDTPFSSQVAPVLDEIYQQYNIQNKPYCTVVNKYCNQSVNLLGVNEYRAELEDHDGNGGSEGYIASFSASLYNSINEGLIEGLSPYKQVLDSVAQIITEIRKNPHTTEKVFKREIEKSQTDVTWILHLLLLRCLLDYQLTTSPLNGDAEEHPSDTSTINGFFTADQKTILTEIVSILEVFEEAVNMMESNSLPISMCLPSLVGLKTHLTSKLTGPCSTLAQSLLSALNKNFVSIETNPLYVCGAVLDPRFRLTWCVSETNCERYKEIVLQEAQAIYEHQSNSPLSPSVVSQGPPSSSNIITGPCSSNIITGPCSSNINPSPLATPLDTAFTNSKLFSFIPSTNLESKSTVLTPSKEMENYLKEQDPVDPLTYWKPRTGIYPSLSKLAKCCLCLSATPTSISKVFHQATSTYNEGEYFSSTSPEELETLIFLKANVTEFKLF